MSVRKCSVLPILHYPVLDYWSWQVFSFPGEAISAVFWRDLFPPSLNLPQQHKPSLYVVFSWTQFLPGLSLSSYFCFPSQVVLWEELLSFSTYSSSGLICVGLLWLGFTPVDKESFLREVSLKCLVVLSELFHWGHFSPTDTARTDPRSGIQACPCLLK